jgi:RsiW-degrading membrane proteinase PrsW (M82 family)
VSISVTCPACAKRLKAKDELAGRLLPCPNCKQQILIPEPGEELASYSLQAQAPPAPPPQTRTDEEVPTPRRRQTSHASPKRRKPDLASLPPLTTNEPPLWLRHLHWLLVLALLPLAFSLLHPGGEKEGIQERIDKTIEQAPLDVQLRIAPVEERIEKGEASSDDFFAALPGQKVIGAFLPHNSHAHWGFAAGSAVLFMAFFLLLSASKTAEPLHLLGIGLFTATIGILLLLTLQLLAHLTQGVWLRGGGVVTIIFYIVKLIGFSYQAALDPENGFILSFLGYTLGVGFCEEVCKALPLLWHYRQPSDRGWRTAFLWGLASGAGFGISEGITYAGDYYNGVHGLDIYIVRFISCVALHALWTVSVGITLQQKQGLIQGEMAWHEYIPRLVVIVGIPMVLHGLYDTLLKKDMNAGALAVAVLSFLFLAFQISRLHGADDDAAREAMLREYKRRRAAMS